MRTTLLFIVIISLFSCKKNPLQPILSPNLPTLTTLPINNISTTPTEVETGGIITDDGNAPVTARGVVYSEDSVPDISNSQKTIDSSGTGLFVSHLSGLKPGTKYYVRAYATNSKGTSYGNEITFTTLGAPSANLLQFSLFKNSYIDTILYKDSLFGGVTQLIEANRGFRSDLDLPNGVFLYVRFDSISGKISASADTANRYFVNSGDTMHFIRGINTAQLIPVAGYTLMGDAYDSKCYYSIHLSGKAETSGSQYSCHYSIQRDPTISWIFVTFNSDSTYNCDYTD
jgi:hypothetical protein